jgi:HK97 family phage major capsid protein
MEDIKKLLQEELEQFKASVPALKDVQSLENAFNAFKTELNGKFDGLLNAESLKEIEASIEKQGELIQKLEQAPKNVEVSFKEQYKENLANVEKALSNGGSYVMPTTRKAITAASIASNTLSARQTGVGEMKIGIPYIADLIPTVTIGNNSGGTVSWYEQTANTNNAEMVAEGSAPANASAFTWVEKTLSGKRISDYIKVSKNQIKDVDFINGEVQRLVERNMRIKENDQLINGTGLTVNIKGLLAYAQAFVTTGIQIDAANIADLIGKCKTQIVTGMKDAAYPSHAFLNPAEVDGARYAKTSLDSYVFPNLMMGGVSSLAGVPILENSLVAANTLLVGDLSLATLFVFDELVIEMKEVGDDAINGLVTIYAYKRENLRVQDVDVNAFVKVADVTATIAAIKTGA